MCQDAFFNFIEYVCVPLFVNHRTLVSLLFPSPLAWCQTVKEGQMYISLRSFGRLDGRDRHDNGSLQIV